KRQMHIANRIGGRRVGATNDGRRLRPELREPWLQKASQPAFGGCAHPDPTISRGASARSRATSAATRAAAASTASVVVSAPKENRTVAAANCGSRPIARSTYDDSARAALHAEPD